MDYTDILIYAAVFISIYSISRLTNQFYLYLSEDSPNTSRFWLSILKYLNYVFLFAGIPGGIIVGWADELLMYRVEKRHHYELLTAMKISKFENSDSAFIKLKAAADLGCQEAADAYTRLSEEHKRNYLEIKAFTQKFPDSKTAISLAKAYQHYTDIVFPLGYSPSDIKHLSFLLQLSQNIEDGSSFADTIPFDFDLWLNKECEKLGLSK